MLIAGAVAFLLTEDVTQPMALIDTWTPLMVVILVVGIIGMLFGYRFADQEDEAQENAYGA